MVSINSHGEKAHQPEAALVDASLTSRARVHLPERRQKSDGRGASDGVQSSAVRCRDRVSDPSRRQTERSRRHRLLLIFGCDRLPAFLRLLCCFLTGIAKNRRWILSMTRR